MYLWRTLSSPYTWLPIVFLYYTMVDAMIYFNLDSWNAFIEQIDSEYDDDKKKRNSAILPCIFMCEMSNVNPCNTIACHKKESIFILLGRARDIYHFDICIYTYLNIVIIASGISEACLPVSLRWKLHSIQQVQMKERNTNDFFFLFNLLLFYYE